MLAAAAGKTGNTWYTNVKLNTTATKEKKTLRVRGQCATQAGRAVFFNGVSLSAGKHVTVRGSLVFTLYA